MSAQKRMPRGNDKLQQLAKRRKFIMDPVTASAFLDHNFDLGKLAEAMKLSEDEVKELLLSSVKHSVIGFPSATLDDLKPFRGTRRSRFNSGERERLTQIGDAVLEEYRLYRQRVKDVVRPRRALTEAENPQIYEAQQNQPTAPITITSNTGSRPTSPNDHLVIAPEYKVSQIFGEGEGEVTFQGPMDYTVVVVNDENYQLIKDGLSPLPPLAQYSVLTIAEATSPSALERARPQIEAQCLALLKATGRAFYAGALTNGVVWFFFLAVANTKGFAIYESPGLDGRKRAGFVVGILLELIRKPGTLPPIFELEDF
ncbi:hypothetical protein DFH09DRAFT_1273919 [Mycena vulgaris]|nr:hypothetical protein DFH09DRAFT_1273919 [Mycena vulgaris]